MDPNAIRYCLGFLFSKDKRYVALIWKTKPKAFNGLLNGIGGKLWARESAITAMIREFLEECGLLVHGWQLFCTLHNEIMQGVMYTFRATLTVDGLPELKMLTPEKPEWFLVEDLLKPEFQAKQVGSVKWLLPMALDAEIANCEVLVK